MDTVDTTKALEELLEEGEFMLDALKEGMQFEIEARQAMFRTAEERALAIVRKATGLTEAEFKALTPTIRSDDNGDCVILSAYGYDFCMYLTVSSLLDLGEDNLNTVEVRKYNRYDNSPVNRQCVAEWLARSQEAAEMRKFTRELQEQKFVPFVWYRVWYSESDYYDLRHLPRFNQEQFGMTVDEPFKLVWVPNPIRVEQMVVGRVEDLPGWCPMLTINVRGQNRHIQVPPTWAGAREDDALSVEDFENQDRWVRVR